MFANATGSVIGLIWLAWLICWLALATRTKAAQRTESMRSRLTHIVPLSIGVILIGTANAPDWSWLSVRIFPHGLATYGFGVALLLLGLGFTVWARVHLAGNWSGNVTLKKHHELVQSGPYRWVRHPIYSGLLLAFLGCALVRGEVRGLLGLAIISGAFIRKLHIEEHVLREAFPEQYRLYQAKVPALIPFAY